ncbi:energy transduction protein TonB [Campylobacter blaseri]|uniref:TonB C-terminal domain-containing protein n=1 Tax=Campylobacter blaseri TaxID=2042961 RepID=A0A2P8QZT8_9BACT|nr:TonB family protein [Campylobacter blaseri]PSM51765.1 hypothetical protein CQ405_06450 [Campylobacter blaseri]PSM53556.1 hypothetical protein CRN67_06455 [Campylobacter blaseri]QKF86364.1 energy transduction protein TonB [Campylobacter blaseri]
MKKDLNFIVAFFISALLHTCVVALIFFKSLGQDTSISISENEAQAFGLSFAQIAQTEEYQEAMAKKEEIVEEQPEEAVEEITEEQPEEEKLEEEKPEEIVEKKPEEVVTVEPKKIEKPKSKSKPAKKIVKKQNIEASNSANVVGGTTASGSNTPVQDSGSNLNGEIYLALKRHMSYPKRAIEQEIGGRVIVEFKQIDKSTFEYIKIAKSSGHKVLDNHAIKIVNDAKYSLPVRSYGRSITIPIIFDLNQL